MLRRFAVFLLCAAILLTGVPTVYADAPYMGGGHTYYRSHTYTPAAYTRYTVNSLRHTAAGVEEEHILSFLPNQNLRAVVVSSDTLYNGGLTLDGAMSYLRGLGYDVIGGINSSFFNTNMTPIGLQIKNGVITSLDGLTQPCIGFLPDGSVLFGEPGFSVTVESANGSVVIDKLNKTRSPDLVHMFTRDFGTTTQTTLEGTHIVISAPGKLSPGGTLTGVVSRVLRGTAPYTLSADEIVISVSTQTAADRVAFLSEGSLVSVNVRCADQRWNGVINAAGGLHSLIKDGVYTGATDNARHPRTAAGITAAGEVIFYTADGRQPGYSSGLSLKEVAERLLDMGCVTAFEFDGGGSTSMSVRMPGENAAKIVNKPSDGSLRKCADFIILCNTAPATDGRAVHLFPQPAYITMMPGATASFSMLAADEAYRPAALSGEMVYAYAENPGVGIANYPYFTAQYPGETTLNFYTGGAYGTAQVNVTSRLDSLTVTDAETGLGIKELTLAPGQSVTLTASGTLNNRSVLSSPHSFYWSVEGNAGWVTPEGVFTAAPGQSLTGSIIVTGGGQTAVVPVSVGADPIIIEDFENGLGILSQGSENFSAAIVNDINIVERGTSSASLSYDFSKTESYALVLPATGELKSSPFSLHCLITGDGSGNIAALSVTTADGSVLQVPLGILDFTDTRYLSISLPENTVFLSGLLLIPGSSGITSGTFVIHQFIVSWDDEKPEAPPDIEILPAVYEGDTLRYTLRAADSKGELIKNLFISWDGIAVPFNSAQNGWTEVVLPVPTEGLHVLSVAASDEYGSRVRKVDSIDLGRNDSTSAIRDARDSWYTGYVDFLDARGILDTVEEFGLRYYYPTQEITRIELMTMLTRVLNLSIPSPEQVILPFVDQGELSEEEAGIVRAIYASNLLGGKLRDGSLYVDPKGKLTRAELFVILNKVLPRGYSRSALEEFSDTGDVPAYALRAAQTLVGMKVVSGSGGKLNPNNTITRAEIASLFCRFFY